MPVIQIRNRILSPNHINFSGPGYNVMHVLVPSPYTVGEVQNALVDIQTFYNALVNFYRAGASVSVGERVLDITSSPPSIVGTTPLSAATASSAPTSLPPEVAAVVSWRTATTGPRYRGRTYIGPLALITLDADGTFTSAFVSALNTAANNLITSLGANTPPTPLHVRSRKFGTSTPVLSAVADEEPDTQRRRGQ